MACVLAGVTATWAGIAAAETGWIWQGLWLEGAPALFTEDEHGMGQGEEAGSTLAFCLE